jgi:hypothetical protein
MKVAYKVNERTTLDMDVKDAKQAFQFLSYIDGVFGVKECGNCGQHNLSFRHFKSEEGYDFYSVKCADCGHELKFGQTREGNRLFPKGWSEPYKGGSKRKSEDQGDDQAPFGGDEDDGYDEKPRGRAKATAGKASDDDIAF